MPEPDAVIDGYLEHRLVREQQILGSVVNGAGTIGEIVEWVYVDVDPGLYPMASRSVAAHLRKLSEEGVVDLPQGSADWTSPVRPMPVPEQESEE
jgi:hypothetical protein